MSVFVPEGDFALILPRGDRYSQYSDVFFESAAEPDASSKRFQIDPQTFANWEYNAKSIQYKETRREQITDISYDETETTTNDLYRQSYIDSDNITHFAEEFALSSHFGTDGRVDLSGFKSWATSAFAGMPFIGFFYCHRDNFYLNLGLPSNADDPDVTIICTVGSDRIEIEEIRVYPGTFYIVTTTQIWTIAEKFHY